MKFSFRTTSLISCLVLSVNAAAGFLEGQIAWSSGDYRAALQEWKPLAVKGDPEAQYWLAGMHENGEGVIQDHQEAVKWYTMSAKQGFAPAQGQLGIFFQTGPIDFRDYKKSVRWLTAAAEQGIGSAQLGLAAAYIGGWGVIGDYVYAHMWLNIAIANGAEEARGTFETLKQKMTSSQIAEAQRLARECVKKEYKNC